jgi:hypothetical protein
LKIYIFLNFQDLILSPNANCDRRKSDVVLCDRYGGQYYRIAVLAKLTRSPMPCNTNEDFCLVLRRFGIVAVGAVII